MPYILNKTNGTILTTVQDAALDSSTDLNFVGKNFAGYGEVQNENFLRLLENFANTSAPPKPITGEIWYNSLEKKLYCYNGTEWIGVSNLEIGSSTPQKTLSLGDLWFDSANQQLKVYNGTSFTTIGPASGFDVQAGWRGSYEYNYSESEGLLTKYAIKAVFESNDDVVAMVSAETYTLDANNVSDSNPVYPNLEKVYRGITLVGADPNDGKTEAVGNYFWGTAAHSLRSNTATYAISSEGTVYTLNTNTNASYPVLFGSTTTGGSINIQLDPDIYYYNPNSNTLFVTNLTGTASSARYADLAERYHSDAPYEPGTVVVIGGENEITTTDIRADIKVAGVISTQPGVKMNSEAGPDSTHPYVALKGRVICKVVGDISKGQFLVSSSQRGYAEAATDLDDPRAIIGIALSNSNNNLVEIKI